MTKLATLVFTFLVLMVFSCSSSSDDQNINQSIVKEITDLFEARDKAVLDSNLNDILNTQLDNKELYGASAEGYISCSKMTTIILKIVEVKSNLHKSLTTNYVVFVQEDYDYENKYSHSAYLIYYLVNTNEGLRINDTNVSAWDKLIKRYEEKQQEN